MDTIKYKNKNKIFSESDESEVMQISEEAITAPQNPSGESERTDLVKRLVRKEDTTKTQLSVKLTVKEADRKRLTTETGSLTDKNSSETLQAAKRDKQKNKRKRRRAAKAVEKSIEVVTNQLSGLSNEDSTPEVEKPGKRFKGENSGNSTKASKSTAASIHSTKVKALGGHPSMEVNQGASTSKKPTNGKGSYAHVASGDLTMGISDTSLDGPLVSAHLESFKTSLLCALDKLCDDAGDVGFIGNAKLIDGFIVVKCKNQLTKKWLISTSQTLTNLWEGAKLRIDSLSALRNETRIVIITHGSAESKDAILKRLQRQNTCVKDTSKWRVTHTEKFSKAGSEGVAITIWCPAEDAESIKKAGGSLNCGLDQATVKFKKNGK